MITSHQPTTPPSTPLTAMPLVSGLLLIAIPLLIATILQPLEDHLAKTLVDDAFYYLGYAHNIAAGNGPTFDGQVFSNGVQPLWAAMLTAVAWLVPDRGQLIYAMMGLSLTLIWCSGALITHALRGFIGPRGLALFAALYFMLAVNPRIAASGMEIPTVFFAIAVALHAQLRLRQATRSQLLLAGAAIALLFLARIDLLVLTPIFAAVALWRVGLLQGIGQHQPWPARFAALAWLALPSIIVTACYFAFNLALFGVALPISGVVKGELYSQIVAGQGGPWTLAFQNDVWGKIQSSFSALLESWLYVWPHSQPVQQITATLSGSLAGPDGIAMPKIMIAVAMVSALVYALHRRLGLVPLLVLTGTLLLFHAWLMNMRLQDGANYWYYMPDAVTAMLLLAWLGDAVCRGLERNNPRVAQAVFALLLTVSATITLLSWSVAFRPSPTDHPLVVFKRTADWIDGNVPPGEVIGAWDAGVIGYFTPRHTVVNLDGLMNDRNYLTEVKLDQSKPLTRYLAEQNVTWLANFRPDNLRDQPHFQWVPYRCLEQRWMQPYFHYFVSAEMLVFKADVQCLLRWPEE